jgi:hypothetical protein
MELVISVKHKCYCCNLPCSTDGFELHILTITPAMDLFLYSELHIGGEAPDWLVGHVVSRREVDR